MIVLRCDALDCRKDIGKGATHVVTPSTGVGGYDFHYHLDCWAKMVENNQAIAQAGANPYTHNPHPKGEVHHVQNPA